jgi:hypothetical protein
VWPPHFPPTDPWKKFFVGVRRLGPDLSFFEELRATQASRRARCMDSWGADRARRELVFVLCAFLHRDVGWPGRYFIPEDMFSTCLYGPQLATIDDLRAEALIDRIEERTGIRVQESDWERIAAGTLGAAVDELLRHKGPP